MSARFSTLLLAALLGGISNALTAADAKLGETLTVKHCQQCHQSEVYTRTPRLVQSYGGLLKQVSRCELAQELKWFDEDVENVAAHLNAAYYHLPTH